MNKKQARNLRQKRHKQWDQNARLQMRLRERQKEIAELKIEFVGEKTTEYIAEHYGETNCLLCEETIKEDAIRQKQFAAFRTRNAEINLIHPQHLFMPDMKTPVPNAQNILTEIMNRIADKELGEFK